MADGAALFSAQCAGAIRPMARGQACFATGRLGVVNGKPALVAQILLHGINGPISVKGSSIRGKCRRLAPNCRMSRLPPYSVMRSQWAIRAHRWMRPVAAARAAGQSQSQPWAGLQPWRSFAEHAPHLCYC